MQYGVTSGLIGILGLLIVGRLADRLSSNDFRWLLWLVAAMTATMIPFSAMAFFVDNRSLAVLFISLSYVVGTAYMAPSIAAIQRLARAEQRDGVGDLPVLQRYRRVSRAVRNRRHQRRAEARPRQHGAGPGLAHRAGDATCRRRLLRGRKPAVPARDRRRISRKRLSLTRRRR